MIRLLHGAIYIYRLCLNEEVDRPLYLGSHCIS